MDNQDNKGLEIQRGRELMETGNQTLNQHIMNWILFMSVVIIVVVLLRGTLLIQLNQFTIILQAATVRTHRRGACVAQSPCASRNT